MNIFEALLENKKTCKLITKAYRNYAWKLWSGEKNARIVNCEHKNKLNSALSFDSFVESLIDYDFSYNCAYRDIEWYNGRIADVFYESGIGYYRGDTYFRTWNIYKWDSIYEEFQEKLNNRINKNFKKIFGLDCRYYKNEVANYMFSGMISEYYKPYRFMEVLRMISNYKFNTSGFNFQENFDLAYKIANNTLSIADKAEASIIFNDIKERLIAA